MNSKQPKTNDIALYKMTDADLKKVLKTVDQKIAHSMNSANAAHLARLAKIQACHGA